MANLFVHLPFEKKSVKCPVTSLGEQRLFPLPTLRSSYQPIQIESFVRLHLICCSLWIALSFVAQPPIFPPMGQDGQPGKDDVPTVILS